MTSVPGFLTKTFEIFSSPEYSDCCGWGPNGDTIIIRKIEQFSKEVLPKYFKHSNFQSFVRQLNMYDFHKTVQDPNHGEFQHQYFRQNQPELLVFIKRKANNRATENLKKFSANRASHSTIQSAAPSSSTAVGSHLPRITSTADDASTMHDTSHLDIAFSPEALTKLLPEELVQETDSVFQELEQQKLMREEFEKRMEEKLSKVEGENQMLKRLFFESHQKNLVLQERMERVLKTLYSVFVGSPAGKALAGRMPNMLLTDYSSSSAQQPLRAIMDKNSVEETANAKSNQEYEANNYNSAAQSDFDGALIDLQSFEKLPSIDLGQLPGPANASYEQYNSLKQSLAGKELSRGGRLGGVSSFDFAAASVAPPLKYLPSFDASYFNSGGEASGEDSLDPLKSLNGNEQYHSDRVTLLSEESESQSNQTRSTRSSRRRSFKQDPNSERQDQFPGQRGTKRSSEEERGGVSTSLPSLSAEKRRRVDVAGNNLSNPQSAQLGPGSSSSFDSQPLPSPPADAAAEDMQFIDLLHRNQDSTLTRLDSLEQTIATLLEGIDYDDPLPPDASSSSNPSQPNPNPSSNPNPNPATANPNASAVSSNDSINNTNESLSQKQSVAHPSSASLVPSETDSSGGRNYATLSAQAVSSSSQLY